MIDLFSTVSKEESQRIARDVDFLAAHWLFEEGDLIRWPAYDSWTRAVETSHPRAARIVSYRHEFALTMMRITSTVDSMKAAIAEGFGPAGAAIMRLANDFGRRDRGNA